ncbi:MAG: hypothetical protein AAGF11_07375 [Myxococcota bacterium]
MKTSTTETGTTDTGPIVPECGNGIVEPGEECDDGGKSEDCDADCTPAECGDGLLNQAAGEQCDAGGKRTEACDIDCTNVNCRDGTINTAAGEECDDQGESMTCNTDCTSAFCGDGITNTSANEECDDMGESMTCDEDCTMAICGDGITNIMATEQCDGLDLLGEDCVTQGLDGGTLACLADCSAFDVSGCHDCGDDMAEGPEICDGNDLGKADCVTQGFDYGTLSCLADCSDYDTSNCGNYSSGCCAPNGTPGCDDSACTNAVCAADPSCCGATWNQDCADLAFSECPIVCDNCGDGMINSPVEVCDGADLMGQDCDAQGFDTGTLGCQPNCLAFDTSGCINYGGDCCGDNGTPGCDNDVCTADICATNPACCSMHWDEGCGDAAFTICPEVCDNCGDGAINSPVEECDDGIETAACNDNCTLSMCGDGIVNTSAGEQCDDGNGMNGDGCDDQCMNEVQLNVLLCGGSQRDVTSFFPAMSGLNLVIGCTPDMDTQAILITRSGINLYNAAEISAYVSGGGIVLTEALSSDEVFSDLFQNVAQGAMIGSCLDRAPIVFQYNAGDAFWLDNPFNPIPLGDSGCGRDVSAYPGITPLVGWNNATVSIAYRDLGTGRMWITDFDWQDLDTPENDPSYADTNSLMGYMITHGQ